VALLGEDRVHHRLIDERRALAILAQSAPVRR
jgi:hypothetical protein